MSARFKGDIISGLTCGMLGFAGGCIGAQYGIAETGIAAGTLLMLPMWWLLERMKRRL